MRGALRRRVSTLYLRSWRKKGSAWLRLANGAACRSVLQGSESFTQIFQELR